MPKQKENARQRRTGDEAACDHDEPRHEQQHAVARPAPAKEQHGGHHDQRTLDRRGESSTAASRDEVAGGTGGWRKACTTPSTIATANTP